jgi:hypothetical protein
VIVDDLPHIRHNRVWGEEEAQGTVIVPCVVVHQPGAILLLAGEACPERGEGVRSVWKLAASLGL